MKAITSLYPRRCTWGLYAGALLLLGLFAGCPAFEEDELGAPRPENEFFHFTTDEEIGNTPTDIVFTALNNDDHADVIAVNRNENTVTVRLGTAEGFAPRMPYPTGQSPRMVSVEDFNGDAVLDMAVVNALSDSVSIWYGLGDGSFDLPTQLEIPLNARPVAMTTIDINDDGGMDLLTANQDANTVSLWLNHPNQPFFQRIDLNVGTKPLWVTTADLDNNGDLDIITANSGSDDLSVLYAEENDAFLTAVSVPMGTAPQSVCAVDLNEDGLLDLAAACLDTPGLILRMGIPGGFGETVGVEMPVWPVRLLTQDFNGDGHEDLAMTLLEILETRQMGDKIALCYGDGQGGFEAIRYFGAGLGAIALAEGALNQDTYPDILTANYNEGEFTLLYGLEGGAFSTEERFFVGQEPLMLAALEHNGDNYPDIAVLHSYLEDTDLLTGKTYGVFDWAGATATGFTPYSTAVADLNDDGLEDLVATHYNSTATVMLSNGLGGFSSIEAYSTIADGIPLARNPRSVALGDLDGDEDIDMVVGNTKRDAVAIFFNDGEGVFSLQEEHFIANYPQAVQLADLDLDGVLDLVCIGSNDPDVPSDQGLPWLVRELGAGDGSFRADTSISYTTSSGPADLVLGDLDGDGYWDAVTSHPGKRQIQIRYGREDGRFGETDLSLVSNTVSKLALADVSGDGLLDILYTANENVVGVLKNQGNREHTTPINFPVGESPTSLQVIDVDQDGLQDVIMVNRYSYDLSLLRGKLPPVAP